GFLAATRGTLSGLHWLLCIVSFFAASNDAEQDQCHCSSSRHTTAFGIESRPFVDRSKSANGLVTTARRPPAASRGTLERCGYFARDGAPDFVLLYCRMHRSPTGQPWERLHARLRTRVPWGYDAPEEGLEGFLASLAIPFAGAVLDVGCGNGRNAALAVRRG